MTPLPVTFDDIRQAALRIADAIPVTPAVRAPRLDPLADAKIHLKLETLNRTGSFKERGALNKLLSLSAAESEGGVIAVSAGNHAQGVACHAARLGIPATIVMPEGTPFTKIERTETYGATVILRGASLSEAREAADALALQHGLTWVHPYDDPAVIAGQGTIALEFLASCPDLDTLIVPVGGGGMISGMAVAAKALRPGIEIVGVQSALYPAMHHAARGTQGNSGTEGTIAEGIAVREPGLLTRRIVAALVSDIVLVEEGEIERAIALLLDRQKLVAEGAGAAGVAALLAAPERFRGRKVGIVICGGNIDARLLASVLMRSLVQEGRLVSLRAELPDIPGALARLSRVIGERGANIVEVHHQRLFQNAPLKRAELDVIVETQNERHVTSLIAALAQAGFPTQLLPKGTSSED